jgi:3-oxoacyl-[acyl-carrier protein] reductase
MMDLKGKKAMITGASRGIGRTVALKLAEAGADIAFTYKTSDIEANKTKAAIRALGQECLIYKADVRDRIAMAQVFGAIDSNWGSLDILVNNAGINIPTDFDKIQDEDWDEVLSVNLKGPFICTQMALPLLGKNGNASVINIGSVSGQYGGPRTAHYAASKAGLISLSQVIARFGANRGIRSNTIAAGIIASEMGSAGISAPSVAKAAENILLGRLGDFEDVALAAVFLASDDSKYITAQTINVNGGLYF